MTTQVKALPLQSIGDVVDKMSILTRKVYFGEEDAYKELTYLIDGLSNMGVPSGKVGEFTASVIRLTQMNFEIWNLENELRRGGEDKFSLEEIGKRAVKIRDLNKKRVHYKNELNQLTGMGFVEFKIKHRSQ